MGGEGSIAGMIAYLKNNRNLLKNRRKPFNKDKLERFPNTYHKAIREKRISKIQLEKLKSRIRKERKTEKIRLTIVLIGTIFITLAIVVLLIKLFEKNILV